jgi:aspartyl-tRNA(Asn)/glutamyl-tRNA(Gln) amidotransferase subunit C
MRSFVLRHPRAEADARLACKWLTGNASGAAMSVDTKTVRHIAKLARISVSDSEVEALAPELSNILGWIEQLQEVDVSGVLPMTAVIPNKLRLREDKVDDGGIRDAVLKNAPVAEHGFFAVPKVIE